MKRLTNSLNSVAAVFGLAILGMVGSVDAQVLPGEVKAQIGLQQGGSPMGYIQGSNQTAILFSTVEGQRGQALEFSKLKGDGLDIAIQIDGGAQFLSPGRTAFRDADYETAAAEFGKVVEAFGTLAYIPRNFATEAAWYQIESLRRAGRYSEIAPVFEKRAALTMETHLPENFQQQLKLNKLWSEFGAGNFDAVTASLAAYVVPAAGNAKLLPTENFDSKLDEADVAQLAFLRAKIAEKAGNKEAALQDYYRAAMLNFSNDSTLSKNAMIAAMEIQAADPAIENEKNTIGRAQLQGLAYQFKNTYGPEDLPAAAATFAIRPEIKADLMAPPVEDETAAPEADKGAEDGKGKGADDKKGDGKAEETKGKGKG